MVKFLVAVILMSVLVAGAVLLGIHYDWFSRPSFFYESLAFTALTTTILFVFLYRVKNPSIFIQLYLLSLVVKILGSGIFIFLIALKDKPGTGRNVIFFLCVYAVFTALEVGFLYYEKGRNQSV